MTLLKEPQTGDYILEAGALVLADQGVEFSCCFFLLSFYVETTGLLH